MSPSSPEPAPTGLSHLCPSWVPQWVQNNPPKSHREPLPGKQSQEQEATGLASARARTPRPGGARCPHGSDSGLQTSWVSRVY